MISRLVAAWRRRQLAKANEACVDIAMAIGAAYLQRDQAAARYFEAELMRARAKRDALATPVPPRRTCACTGDCNQGRTCPAR